MRREEQQHCIALMEWADKAKAKYPELGLLYHIPNGGARSKAEGGILKAMGVKAGMPDYCLPTPRCGYAALYIEMKTQSGRIEKHQLGVMEDLANNGNLCCVCRSVDEAMQLLQEYMTNRFGRAAEEVASREPNVNYAGRA